MLDLGERQVEVELRVEASGGDEVFLGRGERPAIRVDQPAVVQRPCLPEPVAVPAEDDERAAVAVQRLVEPMVVVEEDCALELKPRARDAAECGPCGIDLAEGAARVSRVEQRATQAHPRFRRPQRQLGSLRDPDGPSQSAGRRVAVSQSERGEAERALGDGDSLDVLRRLRGPQHLLGEHFRAPG